MTTLLVLTTQDLFLIGFLAVCAGGLAIVRVILWVLAARSKKPCGCGLPGCES